VLRAGLLSGRTVALAGDVPLGVRSSLGSLGAALRELPAGELDDDQAEAWVRSVSPVQALVASVGALESDEAGRLESGLDRTWTAVRAVAARALIPKGGGKIVLLGPPLGTGAHASALRAGVENLARTLSVEWARHNVTVTAITSGAGTDEGQLATVVAFLLSPAGDYFSGCRLELGAAAVAV
jgi:NAD(P)-dependent dehydrogenase (short-subunit alcohol dehydrogenase family)